MADPRESHLASVTPVEAAGELTATTQVEPTSDAVEGAAESSAAGQSIEPKSRRDRGRRSNRRRDEQGPIAANLPVEGAGAGTSRKGQDRQRTKSRERSVEAPKNSVIERARSVHYEVSSKMRELLYNRTIVREADEGETPEAMPEEEWSYNATRIQYSKTKLLFNYDKKPGDKAEKPKKTRGKKGPERPYKEIKLEQTADSHAIARDNIIYLTTDAFNACMAKVDAEIAEAKVKANVDGKGAEVLQVVGEDKTLEAWLFDRKIQLEWGRVEVIRDAADWFDVRVDQVERLMHEVTKRTDEPSTMSERLDALSKDEDFLEQEENLGEDIKMFESFLELPLTPGAEATRTVVKGIVDEAKAKMTSLDSQKKRLLSLGVPTSRNKEGQYVEDRENGTLQIDRTKNSVKFLLNGRPIADKFIAAAEKRLVGLSPEEELNFWKGVKDLFEYVSDEIPDTVKGPAFYKARSEREVQINRALNLYVGEAGAESFVDMEKQAGPEEASKTDPKEGLPQGFGQVVERCRSEAKLVGDLKDELFFLMGKMGYETRKATQAALRGSSNSKKIEAVKNLNKRADQVRGDAFRMLQEIKPESSDMDDVAKTALASANEAAKQFKIDLAGRGPKDLKWNRKEEGKKEADRPLLIPLREKMAELMGLGTLDDLDLTKLREILFPQPLAEKAGGKPEQGEVVTAQLLEQILTGDLPEEVLAGAPDSTAETLRDQMRLRMKRLNVAVQSGPVRETIKKHLVILQPKEPKLEYVNAFVNLVESIVQTCELCKQTFGSEWSKQFGLWQPDSKGNQRGLGNEQLIIKMLDEMNAGVPATEALFRAGGDTVLHLMLAKARAADVAIPANRKDDVLIGFVNAVSDGSVSKVDADMVTHWSTEVFEAKQGDREGLFRSMLDGKIDPAVAVEAFPPLKGREKIPESVGALCQKYLSRIEAAGSVEIRKAVVELFIFVIPPNLSPVDTVKKVAGRLVAVAEGMEQMKTSDADWANNTGLLRPSGEVNESILIDTFERMRETNGGFAEQLQAAVAEGAAEPEAESPVNAAKLITELFAGTVDQAVLDKVYPSAPEQLNVSPEILKDRLADVSIMISEALPQGVAPEMLRQDLHLAFPADYTPTEVIKNAIDLYRELANTITGLRRDFGDTWALDIGMVEPDTNLPAGDFKAKPEMLKAVWAEAIDQGVLRALIDVGGLETINNLLSRIDAADREILNKLQIEPIDQLAMIITVMEKNVAASPSEMLRRIGKYLMVLDPDQSGEALLTTRGILKPDGNFNESLLVGTVINRKLDSM